jgi:hypothetical protein
MRDVHHRSKEILQQLHTQITVANATIQHKTLCRTIESLLTNRNHRRAKWNGRKQQTLTLASGCTREDTEEQNETGGKRKP